MAGLLQRLWSGGANKPSQAQPAIEQLWIFPVKSCRGVQVQEATVLPSGLQYDREFVICDADTHRFLTARTIPKMLLIETAIDVDKKQLALTIPADATDPNSKRTTHFVSLERPTRDQDDADNHINDVSIWHDNGLDGFIVGSRELTEDLSAFMGRRVILVQKGFDLRMAGPEGYAQDLPQARFEYEDHPSVSWADEYPVLLVSRASLQDLDHRVKYDDQVAKEFASKFDVERWRKSGKGIEINRFRGNVVVNAPAGVLQPWEEDSWAQVEITPGDDPSQGKLDADRKADFLIAQRCARCPVPSMDPDTAARDPVVPDMFMKKDRFVSFKSPRKLCFGVSVCPQNSIAKIRVGDKVTVVRKFEDRRANGTPVRPEDLSYEQ
ncbi:hypothetical protein OIV83_003111 [Microbotryomycetes sp. JL201]|nr:hypothetical protein OIV83_003111 [Microbotryomycetes sp. JL201]